MGFDVPVLLVAWRRPETTRQVLDAIRAAAPTRLFVACDGPREGHAEEAAAVRECRELIGRSIDWPCTVKRLYRERNVGCRRGVSGALDWFFEQVDAGVVLEDDCVPHADFFAYCAELIERYRDDERVWCISGDNFQDGQWRGDGSYYFSHYAHVWGWASWRRAWKHYDRALARWPAFKASGQMASVFDDPIEARYWSDIWDKMMALGVPDTWDYQWAFTCISHGGLTALPNRNLVRNIGFGEWATHTTNPDRHPTQRTAGVLPLQHPSVVARDRVADAYSFDLHFDGRILRRRPTLLQRLKRRARDWLLPPANGEEPR
ncbi:MAG: glycosyltransferase family 2 protein [Gemmatimonadaceae bacterium]